jgi:hypothetical protein
MLWLQGLVHFKAASVFDRRICVILASIERGGKVFLITLRGAGVALRVNKIGFACKGNRLLQRGPSYIGRSMVAVD